MIVAADSFFDSSTWSVLRNLAIFLVLVFWAATVYWVYKDARRRVEDPWLVGMATLLGAIPPFLGPLIYMLFRPPEYLDELKRLIAAGGRKTSRLAADETDDAEGEGLLAAE